jgi:hypothetical protein
VNSSSIFFRCDDVKWDVGQQVDFVQHKQLRFEKNRWILEGLVFSFCDAEDHDFRGLTKIVARRTHEVAHVLHQEQINIFQVPLGDCSLDHARVQVTGTPGRDLSHWKT